MIRKLLSRLPWGYWSGYVTSRGHRGPKGEKGKP
jgi:hypothetical protein